MTGDLDFEITPAGAGAQVIAVRGRLNMVSAPALTSAVRGLIDSGQSRIVVDLAGCEFADSSGLGALVAGLKAARLAGGDLRLAAPGDQIRLALQLTRLQKVLAPADTVADAVAGF